jgi:hypothetical protein
MHQGSAGYRWKYSGLDPAATLARQLRAPDQHARCHLLYSAPEIGYNAFDMEVVKITSAQDQHARQNVPARVLLLAPEGVTSTWKWHLQCAQDHVFTDSSNDTRTARDVEVVETEARADETHPVKQCVVLRAFTSLNFGDANCRCG